MPHKAAEKARCTLSDKELIEKANDWVSKLAKSGGKAWTLRIPVDFNHDPDMLFIELGERLELASVENDRLRDTLRELLIGIEGLPPLKAIEGVLEKQYTNAKQLLIETQQ